MSERGAQRSIRFRDVRCCLFVSLDFLASVSAGSSLRGLQSQQGPVSAGLSLSRTQSQQASVSPAKSDERRGCSLTNSKLTPLIGIFFKFAPFGRSASATRTIGDTAEPPFEWRSPFIHPPLNLHFSQRKLGKRPPSPPEKFGFLSQIQLAIAPPHPPKNLNISRHNRL